MNNVGASEQFGNVRRRSGMRALFWSVLWCASAVLFGPLQPPAAIAGPSGFVCPSTRRLVSLGQSPAEVTSKCRAADDVRAYVETRTVREIVRQWDPRFGRMVEVAVERSVPVSIEEWTYDFGRNRFVKRLRFENGRLIAIEEGPKGVAPPEE